MESLEHWRLSTDLSVVHAALLMVGIDPSSEVGANCDNWKTHEQPPGYAATREALRTAIRNGKLKARIRHGARPRGWDEEPGEGEILAKVVEIYPDYSAAFESLDPFADPLLRAAKLRGVICDKEPDWNLTTVAVEALCEWLSARGFRSGFFFPEVRQAVDVPDYLDKSHPRYAPKLAATLTAWQLAEGSPAGKSPKETLEQILLDIAPEFGLVGDDGAPNKLGIEECCKVANWRLRGGAPKTPAK